MESHLRKIYPRKFGRATSTYTVGLAVHESFLHEMLTSYRAANVYVHVFRYYLKPSLGRYILHNIINFVEKLLQNDGSQTSKFTNILPQFPTIYGTLFFA